MAYLLPNTLTHTPKGVGTTTIRLADIPLADRLHALTKCEAKTEAEAIRLLRIALDPGDAGGRVAMDAAA